ncbi:hypothetical protein KM043_003908 [Ampulex compressa]|nr:hypothetical protein KM043_003908 [Ampulex compressa]
MAKAGNADASRFQDGLGPPPRPSLEPPLEPPPRGGPRAAVEARDRGEKALADTNVITAEPIFLRSSGRAANGRNSPLSSPAGSFFSWVRCSRAENKIMAPTLGAEERRERRENGAAGK